LAIVRELSEEKGRVKVSLDSGYAFTLTEVVGARLRVGEELSMGQIEELLQESAVEEAYNWALNFLSYRPRSQAEIRRYLARKRISSGTIEAVLGRLERAGLVHDLEFARFWVENREAFRPSGARLLRYELRRKGLGEEAISEALASLDEEASAYRAACKASGRYAKLSEPEFSRRLGAHLARRGFPYALIQDVLRRVWQERENRDHANFSKGGET